MSGTRRINLTSTDTAFCDPAHAKDGPLPSTTNQLEGGADTAVKRMLD